MTTTGLPVEVRKRSLICALTSVSPATFWFCFVFYWLRGLIGVLACREGEVLCCLACCATRQQQHNTHEDNNNDTHLGVVHKALPVLGVGRQLACARHLEALDDGLLFLLLGVGVVAAVCKARGCVWRRRPPPRARRTETIAAAAAAARTVLPAPFEPTISVSGL